VLVSKGESSCAVTLASASRACATVRGKPVQRKPSRAHPPHPLEHDADDHVIGATSSPHPCSACSLPSCRLFGERRAQEVARQIWGIPNSLVSWGGLRALAAPGGPRRIDLGSAIDSASGTLFACGRRRRVPGHRRGVPAPSRLLSARRSEEALVVAHHELRLELLHRVERDADHDDDRSAAEVEVTPLRA